MAAVIASAVLLAALSLRVPWATTYDPWAWIVWGREVLHLDLQTVDGPSWKPLPVAFTTVFSLAGGLAPALWLVTARAGGLLAIAAAYALGRRLAGPVAAAFGATALVLDVPFARVVWLGDSEGILIALVLFAAERHLAGARRLAFVLAVGAALLRPETWPFVAAYGIWLGWRDRRELALVAGGGVLVAALWFLPELWGSGHLWRSAVRATQLSDAAAAVKADPALTVISRARVMLIGPVKAAAIFALVVAAARPRVPRARTQLIIGAGAGAWLALVAAMTARGFSGNERYVMAPVAIVCVLAGVGAATGVKIAARLAFRNRLASRLVAALAAVGALAALVPYVSGSATALGREGALLDYQAALRLGMQRAVEKFGGAEAVLRCGQPVTEDYSVPMLAWDLGVPISSVGLYPTGRTVVFQARSTPGARPDPRLRRWHPAGRPFHAGPVRVFRRCG